MKKQADTNDTESRAGRRSTGLPPEIVELLKLHTSMAARYQHMTDPIRADIAKRVGGLIWKPAELPATEPPADPAGEQEGGPEAA